MTTTQRNTFIGLAALLMAFLVITIGLLLEKPQSAQGSVAVSNEYNATSTSPSFPLIGTSTPSVQVLKGGQGTFGSVIVTGAGAAGGNMDFYDATTTNVNLRASNLSTTSIRLASLPNNIAVGTYTYDIATSYGLTFVFTGTAGTQATTTITLR